MIFLNPAALQRVPFLKVSSSLTVFPEHRGLQPGGNPAAGIREAVSKAASPK